jgi:hypothetical protein
MGYLMAAIVLGMLIWAGFEIVQNIRNWETNPTETTHKVQAGMIEEVYRGQCGGDALEAGTEVIGHAIHASHCATEAACEVSPSVIGHVVEGLLHTVHH